MKANEKVATQLIGFIEKVQEEISKEYAAKYSNLTPPTIASKEGSKFYKIISDSPSNRSVYCFVEKETGQIFKAASWAMPAKKARGSIFDPNYGWGTAVNMYGANYLR